MFSRCTKSFSTPEINGRNIDFIANDLPAVFWLEKVLLTSETPSLDIAGLGELVMEKSIF
jgi:hypothetical protein